MAQELDPRIIQLDILVNGVTKTYATPFYIKATGTKYANALQNECEIVLANLDRETQDYILTQTTPYNRNASAKTITLRAGRESYGTSVIYVGNVVSSTVTQPPDVGIVLKCLTGNFLKSSIISRNQAGVASLSQIGKQIAQDTNTILSFQATDRNISNYNFSGAALNQIALLNSMGGVNAFMDDTNLVIKNLNTASNAPIKIVSAQTGMIEIPQFTEQGIKVKFLLDNRTTLGGAIQIQSSVYPAANGVYVIYKLGFEIATREVPFYYIAEGYRIR